jgi:hypothetical protein
VDGHGEVVTTADRAEDVRMLLYGLRIREIEAHAVETGVRRGDRWAIVVGTADAERARRAIGAAWDAIFETDAARTPDGRCGFCRYDLRGVVSRESVLRCPECGVDLRSLAARRAYRDGGRAPPPPPPLPPAAV